MYVCSCTINVYTGRVWTKQNKLSHNVFSRNRITLLLLLLLHVTNMIDNKHNQHMQRSLNHQIQALCNTTGCTHKTTSTYCMHAAVNKAIW